MKCDPLYCITSIPSTEVMNIGVYKGPCMGIKLTNNIQYRSPIHRYGVPYAVLELPQSTLVRVQYEVSPSADLYEEAVVQELLEFLDTLGYLPYSDLMKKLSKWLSTALISDYKLELWKPYLSNFCTKDTEIATHKYVGFVTYFNDFAKLTIK